MTLSLYPPASGGSGSPLTTKGDLYTRSSSADTRLAVGANGTVLTADSAEAVGIKWATIQGWTLLGSGTLSGASVNLQNIPSTYQNLVVMVDSIVQSTTALCTIRLNNSTTNINVTNTYSTSISFNSYGGALPVASSDSTYYMNNTGHNTFVYTIFDYTSTVRKAITGTGSYKYSTDTNQIPFNVYGASTDSVAYNRVDIVTASGTFSSGNYKIYGVK